MAGSVAGGLISSAGAQSAAKTQAAAQEQAAALQQQQNQLNLANLQPYDLSGQAGISGLNAAIANSPGALNSAFANAQNAIPGPMTQATLNQTPGFQYQLAQGLQQAQNSAAARGLGVSGAAIKGATTVANGLADSNYQNQFNNAQTIYSDQNAQFSNAYNQQNALVNQAAIPVQIGENAAAQSGYQGNTAAANIGSNIAGAGASLAQGTQNAANTIGNSLSSAGNNGYAYLALNNLLNKGSSGYTDSYNPSALGYNGDINSSGGQTLQSLGFVTPLS